ncbi:MAG: transport-associated protein [Labilithrix sp.]|nr:transport-associated protein [Labilithrix sp.]
MTRDDRHRTTQGAPYDPRDPRELRDLGGRDALGPSSYRERDSGYVETRRQPEYLPPLPREGAENTGGFERDGGAFTRERGFGHVPGQRWGSGLSASNANVERSGPPSAGRGASLHGSDMGMGAPEQDRGPHYGKGPKGYRRSDARMLEDACEAIAQHGYVDASDVEVKVKDGVATLTGTVQHRYDKKVLEALVEHVRGIEEVHNQIRIPRPDRKRPEPQEAQGAGASHSMENRELSDERIPDESVKSERP